MLVSGLVNVPYLAPGISVQSLFDEHVSGLGNASGPVKTLKDLDQYVKVMSRKQDLFFFLATRAFVLTLQIFYLCKMRNLVSLESS